MIKAHKKAIIKGDHAVKGVYKMENKKIVSLVLAGVLCILIIVALIDAAKSMKKKPESDYVPSSTQTVPMPVKKEEKVKIKVDAKMIRESLGDMGTLVTADYSFTQVENYTKTKKVFSLIDVNSSFLYSYDGVVYAGVNFKGITVDKNEDTKKITIKVPKADITAVEIDYNSFKVYSEKEGFLNPFKIEDYNMAQKEFDDKARTMAKEKGLLTKADANAKKIIETFVTSLLEKEEEEEQYTIVVE